MFRRVPDNAVDLKTLMTRRHNAYSSVINRRGDDNYCTSYFSVNPSAASLYTTLFHHKYDMVVEKHETQLLNYQGSL